ncbi:MAG: response regulator [Fibrobacterota bacterium]
MRFLVVEDDFFCRSILVNILGEYGHADVAVNGNEAVGAFRRSIEEGDKYTLIFLDIMLPDKDGQTLLKEFRDLEKKHRIAPQKTTPIVMTTALDDKHNILSAFKNQCEGYIVKPVDEAKVIEKLQELELI